MTSFAALAVLAAPAFAGPGLHAGMSIEPDDFLIGLHWKSKPIAEHLALVPSVEAGFGDEVVLETLDAALASALRAQ